MVLSFWKLAFQFALPRGERHVSLKKSLVLFQFQFALPRGERHWATTHFWWILMFQFALPRGERRILFEVIEEGLPVSIRAPAWGATVGRQINTNQEESFNSRSRVGSDQDDFCKRLILKSFNSRSRVGSDAGRHS